MKNKLIALASATIMSQSSIASQEVNDQVMVIQNNIGQYITPEGKPITELEITHMKLANTKEAACSYYAIMNDDPHYGSDNVVTIQVEGENIDVNGESFIAQKNKCEKNMSVNQDERILGKPEDFDGLF